MYLRFHHILLFTLFLGQLYLAQYSRKVALGKLEKIQPIITEKPDSAIVLAREILRNTRVKGIQIHAYIYISISKGFLGEKDSAIYYGNRAEETALLLKNKELISRSCGNLASQYCNAAMYTLAKSEVKEGIVYLERGIKSKNYIWLKVSLYREMAKINSLENHSDSVAYYINRSFEVLSEAKQNNNKYIQLAYASLYNDLSQYYIQKKDYNKAEKYALDALEKAVGLPYENVIKEKSYLNLAYVYIFKEETNRAIDTLKVIEGKINPKKYPFRMEVYGTLAESYNIIDDFNNYFYYKELSESMEEMLQENERKAINNSINSIKVSNEYFVKRNQKNRSIIFGTGTLASLLIIGISVLFYTKRRDKRKFDIYLQKIQEQDSQISPLSASSKKDKKNECYISNKVEKTILKKLKEFEDNKQYNEQNITLYKLSNDFDINTKYLSEVIFRKHGQNFNSYINQLRIDNISQEIIKNPDYRKYKISYLAEISGFSSGETFSRTFKKITGISPSLFINNAKKLKKS